MCHKLPWLPVYPAQLRVGYFVFAGAMLAQFARLVPLVTRNDLLSIYILIVFLKNCQVILRNGRGIMILQEAGKLNHENSFVLSVDSVNVLGELQDLVIESN